MSPHKDCCSPETVTESEVDDTRTESWSTCFYYRNRLEADSQISRLQTFNVGGKGRGTGLPADRPA